MDMMELGALGELVGGIGSAIGGVAVLVTLIYLSVQVRQNTRVLKANARQVASEQIERFCDMIIQDERARRVWILASGIDLGQLANPEQLSEDDLAILYALMYRVANSQQTRFEMTRSGALESAQQAQTAAATALYASSRAGADWWHQVGRSLFHEDFVRSVLSPAEERAALEPERH